MKQAKKMYFHIVVVLLLILGIQLFLPTAYGLTETGKGVLCVMISAIYLWLTVGTGWVSLFVLAMTVLFGLLTPAELYAGTLGNSTVVVIIVCVLLNQVLADNGVIHYLAAWFLTRRVLKGRPRAFFMLFLLGVLLLGFVMNGTALCVTFIALAKGLCDEIGYKKGDPFYTALFAGIFWMANVSNSATPISHPGVLLIIGMANGAGIPLSYMQFMAIGIPYACLMYIAAVVVICLIWKPDTSLYQNYDIDSARARRAPLTKAGSVSLWVFAAVVLLWVLPDIVQYLWPNAVSTALLSWGATIPPILGFTLLSVIHIEDKPIADYNSQIRHTPMSTVIFVSAVLVLGTILNLEGAGVTDALRTLLSPVTGSVSPFVLCMIVFALCCLLTNFISNSVCAVLFFSICIPILTDTSVSLTAFAGIISIVANFGVLVPSSCAFSPLFFGEEHFTVKGILKWNLAMILTEAVLTIGVLFPLANAGK